MQHVDLDSHLAALASQLDPTPARDRRRHKRVCVHVSGALLADQGKEYSFEIIDISAGGVRVKTAARAPLGAKVVLYCESFGRLSGSVARSQPGEMAVCLTLLAHKREKLVESIIWLINKDKLSLQEERRSERYNASGDKICELEGGRTIVCRVLDMSLLGMSLETAERRPHIGERVKIGRAVGSVARYTQKGFAVDFANGLLGSDPLD